MSPLCGGYAVAYGELPLPLCGKITDREGGANVGRWRKVKTDDEASKRSAPLLQSYLNTRNQF